MANMTYEELLQKLAEKNLAIRDLTPEQVVEEQVKDFNNSIGNLNETDGYNCERCHNKGYVSEVAFNERFGYTYEKRMPCKCMRTRATLQRAKRSGLGNIITDYTFDKFIVTDEWQKNLKEKAQRFCKDADAEWFFVGGQVGCVDCDTEYFNGTKWVRIADYTEGDKVLQYNPLTKEGILTVPEKYIVAPSKELYRLKGKRHYIDMCLSANHNFAYVTTKGHMQKKPFAEVMIMHNATVQGFYGKVETAFEYSGAGIDLTDKEIRIMCAVIADGSFSKKLKSCTVNVKNERKKERMRELLKGMNYKEYKKSNGYSAFRFYAPRREKEFTDYWYGCSQEQLKIIVDEVFRWDGSINGKRKSFFSNSKRSADFVQFAISSTGSRATFNIDNHKEKPCYVVHKCSYASTVTMCSTNGRNKASIEKVIPKDNKQYCFTVETGYLILRRNGRIFITGNSGKTHICTAIAAYYIKAGLETQYMLWVEESKKLKALVTDYHEYQRAIEPYKETPVLYIDDFLKTRQGEMPTQADINLAFEIINHRLMSDGKITIISSEKTLGEMLEYDEGTMSRIFQECGEYKNIIERDINKNYRLRG